MTNQRVVFLSASVPDSERWSRPFDPFEITDAVVAFTGAFLTAGWTLVTAAHPTIAPLILRVGSGLRTLQAPGVVRLYQSELFREKVPAVTLELAARDFASLVWTPAHDGDEPEPGSWDRSLAAMRRQMFEENEIDAAVFIGGMEGITTEWELLGRIHPTASRFPIRGAGGSAADLSPPEALAAELSESRLYPFLAELVLERLTERR
jgi:hypothetical protein